MTRKARIRTGYRARPALIALLLIGYGIWAVYDGFYAYPRDNAQHAKLEAFKQQDNWQVKWESYAREEGLPLNPQDIEYHGWSDMYLQYGLMIFCLPVGLLALGVTLRCGWLWVGSDERGLHANGGRSVPWDRITSVDKTRWDSKGIAVVHYIDDQGQPRRLTLDDWKYETEPTRQILKQVESQLGQAHADEEPSETVDAARDSSEAPA
jgi:hypothetical protein